MSDELAVFPRERWRIPPFLADLAALAIAVLDGDGVLLEANRGFLDLLPDATGEAPRDVTPFLLNPTLDDLHGPPSDGTGVVYRGILTLGSTDGRGRSLRGVVHRFEGRLLIVAEHDVEELTRLADVVLAMTEELAEKQAELVRANRLLQRREADLARLAGTDPLTGLANRRSFDARLEEETERSRRSGTPLALVLLDIDRFKRLNDTLGHPAGDAVLAEVGRLLLAHARRADTAARYGGEEFALLCPGLDAVGAGVVAERLRAEVAALRAPGSDGAITASLGVADLGGGTAVGLVARADEALYRAKARGRDRVETADPA